MRGFTSQGTQGTALLSTWGSSRPSNQPRQLVYWWIPPQLQLDCGSEDEGRAEPTVEEVVSEGRQRRGLCQLPVSPQLPPPSPGHEDTVRGTASTFIREPCRPMKSGHMPGGLLLPGEGLSWAAPVAPLTGQEPGRFWRSTFPETHPRPQRSSGLLRGRPRSGPTAVGQAGRHGLAYSIGWFLGPPELDKHVIKPRRVC